MHRVLQFSTPRSAADVGDARNRLLHQVTALDGIGLDDDRRYALRLCASEAIDNGIKHGGSQSVYGGTELLIEVDLDTARQRLRVTVTDGGHTVPSMDGQVGDLEATGGRGLAVIGGYADAVGWGQRMNDVGEAVGWSVWFELDAAILSTAGQATAQAEVQPEAARDQPVVGARAGALACPLAPGPWHGEHAAA